MTTWTIATAGGLINEGYDEGFAAGTMAALGAPRHCIGEPCGAWAGGIYICGCSRPERPPRAIGPCKNCGHVLEGHS